MSLLTTSRPRDSIVRLVNGKPHFVYYHIGDRVYNTFVARPHSADLPIGQIRTDAPVALNNNPGHWFVFGDSRRFDSMDEAAFSLLPKELQS